MSRNVTRLLMLLILTGCQPGMNTLRGHNIAMAIDAVQVARAAGHPTAVKRATDDALDRLALAQRDFPPPKSKIVRSTKEAPNPADDLMFLAYAGAVDARVVNRRRWGNLLAPARAVWSWFKTIIRYGPYVLIAIVLLWIRREFFKRDVVQTKIIGATVKDKAARRAIAEGSPIGRVFDRFKAMWGAPPEKPDIEARGAPESDGDV